MKFEDKHYNLGNPNWPLKIVKARQVHYCGICHIGRKLRHPEGEIPVGQFYVTDGRSSNGYSPRGTYHFACATRKGFLVEVPFEDDRDTTRIELIAEIKRLKAQQPI
jgi:hypothetical protein